MLTMVEVANGRLSRGHLTMGKLKAISRAGVDIILTC